tara:strand:- start:841 stop:1227 length:387 start_codon:yes stop_codon:yes gene_type:complete
MKILGHGIDLLNVDRFSSIYKRNPNFQKRIFSINEIKKCKKRLNKYNCFAMRFAAKEAFVKALGTGISNGIKFKEIEITNTDKGKPEIKLKNKTSEIVKKILKYKYFKVFLTLSDEKPFVVASVLICV